MNRKLLFLAISCIFIFKSYAQQIWQTATNISLSEKSSYISDNYNYLRLNTAHFSSIIKNVPKRNQFKNSSREITLPVSNNKFEVFQIFEASNFSPKLSAKFPSIKSFIAKSITSNKTARFSYSNSESLHAYVSTNKGTIIINPIAKKSNNYVYYNKRQVDFSSDFECSTIDKVKKAFSNNKSQLNLSNDNYLRKYRVAIAATGEYSNFFLTGSETTDQEKKAVVLAAMNNSLTRINGIFERDFGVTMELIDNNDELIFFDETTDPFSADNYNEQLQATLDNNIGSDNYDVGHLYVHSTRIYGNAGCIACVCTDGSKGSAFTAHTDPSSDHFDMIASHEFGHQFGGYHVQSSPNCRSGNNSEVEPGSGSSIMGYAGICAPNVQENPDDYFNYVDIRDILEWTRNGSACAELIPTNNNTPTVNAGEDYIIPISTAFILTGSADDVDDNTSLTYCWEQNNPENPFSTNTPQSNWALGPLYRSKLPVNSPVRYMPQIEDVVNGNLTPTWEVTPSIARTLDFVLTVRDNATAGPKTASDSMTISVIDNGGAFKVTSQRNNINWNAGQIKTITWDVAGTNQAPINAENVDILLSTDGGYTYTHTLASNKPNNGLANIIVPSIPEGTDKARIMVKPTNNIFYAINSSNISIQISEFVMNFSETELEVCKPNNIEYNFNYKTFLGFNENTFFSVDNLPDGLNATFEPSNASENDTPIKLTISGTNNNVNSEITFNVIGSSDSTERSIPLSFNIFESEIASPILSLPENNSTEINNLATKLEWNQDDNIDNYSVEIALDTEFNNIIESTSTEENSYVINTNLNFNTRYYWRIKGENLCSESEFSNTFSFETICSNASNILANNISINSADITWTDTASSNWEIEVINTGETPQGIGVLTSTQSYSLTNLNSSTSYDVYVRAQCSSSNYSEWVGPYRFSTLGDFCNGDKFYDTGGESGNYKNLENIETLILPTSGNVVEIDFEVFQLENGYDYLTIYDGNDTNAPLIGSFTGLNSPGTIRSKPNQGITFVFTSDNIINDIGWEASVNCITVSCLSPEDFTYNNLLGNSVDLSWSSNGSENQWEIEYGPSSFNIGEGTKVITTTNPITINSLNTSTTYDFYIKAICGNTSGEDDSFAVGPLTISTPECGIYTAPYAFNVEDQNTNTTIENCWNGEPTTYNSGYFWEAQSSRLNTSNSSGPYKANTGNNYFTTRDRYSSINDVASLMTPLIDITSLTSPTLNFHSFMYGEFIGSLHVDILNNGTWNEDIMVINGQQQESIHDIWEEHFIDLSTYTGVIQVRFRAITNGNYNNDIAIDDVNIYNLPNCIKPSNIEVSNITGTTADLSWITNGNENSWAIEFGTPNFVLGTGTSVTANSNNFTLEGLPSETEVEIYIKSICGNNPDEDDSTYAGPIKITTPCAAFVAPYNFDVEIQNTNSVIENCWSGQPELYQADYSWATRNSRFYNSSTGPYKANGGDKYFTTSNYYSGSNNNNEASLITPLIDISSLTTPTLNFHSFMYGENIGSLHVDIYNNGTWNNDVFIMNGQQQESSNDFWKEHFIDLSTYTNEIQVRFRAITNGNNNNEIAIDDVNIYNMPNCITPSDVVFTNITANSVDLSWTANGNGTSWIIEYGSSDYTVGEGTSITVNTNNYTLENLPTNSEIDIYIKSTCGNNPGEDDSDNIGPIKIKTLCGVFNAPYNFNVENQNVNPITDNCWSAQPELYQGSYFWEAKNSNFYEGDTGPYQANTGNKYFSTRDYGSSTNDEAILLSPVINTSSLTTPTLNFHSFMYGENIGSLHVDILDNGTWNEDVVLINGQQQEYSRDLWEEHFIDLSAYSNEIQVRFRAISNGSSNNEIAIDDINIYNLPSCIKPSELTFSNITATSVDLSWTANGSGTSWIVEYGTSYFTPGTGTTVTANSNNFTLENLPSNSEIDIYIKSTCGNNPGENDSDSIGPLKINTPCNVFVAPFNTDIEDQNTGSVTGNCWSTNPDFFTGNYYWQIAYSNFNQNRTTGPYKANSGNKYFYTRNSSASVGDEANLLSPIIDISPLTTPTLNFHSFMYGENIGSLRIDIFSNGTWNEDIFVIEGQQQESSIDFWEEHFVDLSDYTGQIQIRFRTISNGNNNNEIAIDDINVYNLPNCIKPSNLTYTNVTDTSVDLSWTANGNGTSWIVEYGATGFTVGSGTTFITNSNNYTLENLPSNSEIDIYIKSTCGNNPGEDDSDFIGPIKIKTPCSTFSAPWYYDVENQNTNSVIADCWSGNPQILQDNYYWATQNSRQSNTTGPNQTSSRNKYFSAESNNSIVSNEANLLSPIIDISSLNTPSLNFFTFMYGENIGSLKVDIFNNGTWNEGIFVLTGQQQESNNDSWTEHFIDLSAYIGQIQIRFRASSNGNFNDHIAIDDISVIEKPDCIKPTNIIFDRITESSVDVNWENYNTNISQYTIEYGAQGFSLGSGTQNNISNNTHTITDLNSDTVYDFYIRSECSNDSNSEWVGPFTKKTTPNYCNGDHFYDSGGPNNPYSNSENYIETIFPSTANGVVTVEFNSFQLEGCCDYLSIYDGSDINAPLIGRYNGNDNPGIITSSDSSGALTFKFTSDHSVTYSGWDATVICNSNTCPNPTNISVEETFVDGASINWETSGAETNWIIEYGESGFTLGTGTIIETTQQPTIVSNLNSQTTYDVYVKASCNNESSNNIKTSFTTRSNYCNGDHFYDTGGEFNNYNNNENYTETITPITGADRVSVIFNTFDLESCCDSLSIYDGSDINAPLIGTYTGTNSPEEIVATNSEGSLTFQFISNDNGNSIGWDATVICEYDCPIPLNPTATNITTNEATITWDAGGDEQSWDIILGSDDIIIDYYTVDNTSFTFTDLEPNKIYQYGIKSNCNENSDRGSSDWIGTFKFRTTCQANFAPFHEKFLSSTTPSCWIENGDKKWNFNTNAVYDSNNVADNSEGNDSNYAWINSTNSTNSSATNSLKTNFINISNLDSPTLQFAVFSRNSINNEYNKLEVKLNDSSNNSYIVLELQEETEDGWKLYTFNLNDFISDEENIQIEFIVSENETNTSSDNNILIDDIKIDNLSTLGTNNYNLDISKLKYYPNPVKSILTIQNNDTELTKIEVYNLIGQKLITEKINDISTDIDFSRLESGTYLIKAFSNKKSGVFKVVKIK
ncbi:fibronectin type III domain-containing protein [Tenacibaculum sp. M341]|uniref:fibronectin type III domain-containing protein n=1 Tax=Tenacibaculum sp. M341 TaxID=2530339 RepID=UPI001047C8FA|nr:fibronectin type III domain-containing protein [Tenacibaculum sp. M341]TCI92639.1 T9SS type A sorting domain-containing protein [Tenacibaculum sp. M341]